MKHNYLSRYIYLAIFTLTFLSGISAKAQVIISQYYEGGSVNKWIELTNLTGSPVDMGASQLKLAAWQATGDAGNISISGNPSSTLPLEAVIPAYGSILVGNPSNGTEVPYLTSASATLTSGSVVNFNGNDGIALVDASNNIIDAFGHGLNAKDISYVRKASILAPNATFTVAEWTAVAIASVQEAVDSDNTEKLGVHVADNLPACIRPTAQPAALTFGTATTRNVTFSFSESASASEYLVVLSTTGTLTAQPVDGTAYSPGDALGGGTVVSRGPVSGLTVSGLTPNTTYYLFVYALNSGGCTGGPLYLTTNTLSGSFTTATLPACSAPTAQPTALQVTSYTSTKVQAKFTATAAAEEYLVVASTSASLTTVPANGTVYKAGDALGNGKVVYRGQSTSFTDSGLEPNTLYYYFIFSLNADCTGGPFYLTNAPLSGSQQTREQNSGVLNFYYGNLHAHSSYSDGNKDDLTKTPAQNYEYAKGSLRMDFLGISEHNHTGAGMKLLNWKPGLDAAKAATTANFVALYGMEWGVISGGGHVIVYGVDSLMNWEAGQYQIYVAKSVYKGANGLFARINKHGGNAIAYLAHPNSSDYNDLSNTYDQASDQAVVGTAVQSGPAFSTVTNYSGTGSMSYLSYYNKMLSKGYYLGPVIDHDNHYFTFGRTAKSRLVILAPELTEAYLLEGMKSMRFYATQDYEAKVYFSINSKPMGSVFIDRYAPNITVTTETSTPVTSIKLMYGVPGSGSNPTTIYTSNSATLTYTHTALANLASGYYYLDITQDNGSRTVTSPIWYTRNDNTVLSVKNDLAKTALFSVWPNPTNGSLKFSLSLADRQNLRVRVLSATGQVVHEEVMQSTPGYLEKQLQLPATAKGLHFVQVQVGSSVLSKKIMVQ